MLGKNEALRKRSSREIKDNIQKPDSCPDIDVK